MVKEPRNHRPNFAVKPLQRLLKKYYENEISYETFITFRDLIEELAEYIAKESARQFKETNHRREKQGLDTRKRMDKYSILTIKNKIYNELSITEIGEIEKHQDTLSCQDGTEQ